jgi:hypothetical protein
MGVGRAGEGWVGGWRVTLDVPSDRVGVRRVTSRSTRWTGLASGVLLVAAIALGGVWFGLGSGRQVNQASVARQAALDTAEQTALQLTGYDYRKIDAQIAGLQPQLAGAALSDFVRNAPIVRADYVTNHLVATSRLLDAATVSSTPQEATVLVSVRVSVAGSAPADPQDSLFRMHVVDSGAGWVVDQLPPVT